MQCAAASHSITQLCSRFPTRVQQARAGRVAPRAVRTRAAEEDERPKRRYVKDEDAMTAEKDLYSLARASYGGPRGQQGAEDMFSGEHPIKRNAAPKPLSMAYAQRRSHPNPTLSSSMHSPPASASPVLTLVLIPPCWAQKAVAGERRYERCSQHSICTGTQTLYLARWATVHSLSLSRR